MAVADILVCALRRDPFYPLLRHCHCHFEEPLLHSNNTHHLQTALFGARIIQIELENCITSAISAHTILPRITPAGKNSRHTSDPPISKITISASVPTKTAIALE